MERAANTIAPVAEAAGLTRRQAVILAFIGDYWAMRGSSPTIKEIARDCGIKSKAGICARIAALCDRGYVTRIRYRQRSYRLTAAGHAWIETFGLKAVAA